MNLPFDSQKLRRFVPLSEISHDNFIELANNITIESLAASKKLFSRGDQNDVSYYLLNGEIEFIDNDGNISTLTSKSKKCRFPLDQNNPRQTTAISKTEIQYFSINKNLLDVLLTWDQNKNYIVSEINDAEVDDNDWMTQLLKLDIFHTIPPANIQAIFQRIQSVPVKKDDVIINQGDKGDFYYIIKSGSCRVMRNAEETGNKELKIADIEAGNSFGEDALITDNPRNATVIMNADGVLMRLAKNDFLEQLKEPVIKSVNYADAETMIEDGAIWLDVRLPSEYQNKKISNSINIPLFLLRLNASKLSKEKKYVVYCDTGSRSASATFILNERGYNAYLLEGGMFDKSAQKEESVV